MGNKLAPQKTAPIDFYLHELASSKYIAQGPQERTQKAAIAKDQILGNGRFLKTIKCQHTAHREGTIVVKVYVKSSTDNSLKKYEKDVAGIYAFFSQTTNPNVFPYQIFFETDKAGYLIRQYFLHNLYDRLNTRPFLKKVEKKWIAYQCLKALAQSHFYGICHGDIKCENVMITSWNWVYLTDFASYKPTFIPDDAPLDFHYFFDTGANIRVDAGRPCYIAPERFYSSNRKEVPSGELTHEMDIFSLGCCIAELFLEGGSDPIFSFSQLLSYRKEDTPYDPTPVIAKIKDEAIQSLIKHMIQKDPSKRFPAHKYIENWSPQVFPAYFSFLHNYMARLMLMDADVRISTIQKDFDEIRKQFTQGRKEATESPILNSGDAKDEKESEHDNSASFPVPSPSDALPKDNSYAMLLETEQFINRLQSEGKNSPLLPVEALRDASNSKRSHTAIIRRQDKEALKEAYHHHSVLETINTDTHTIYPSSVPAPSDLSITPEGSEGFVMILDVVCASLRNVSTVLSKLTALDIFQKLVPHLDDKCRLQRVVPYVVTLLSEPHALIRATALRTLTKVLDKVDKFKPGDSHIFPEYILPALTDFHTAKEEIVREAFAENLAQLAEIARRFLEASQFFKQVSMSELPPQELRNQAYDAELAKIQDTFHKFVAYILNQEPSPLVKRCLLMDAMRLCIFFGREKSREMLLLPILSHDILNGPWELRAAVFHNIVGVSAYMGMDDLQRYYTLITNAFTDEEEMVIDKAINCLASLCELGLFRKQSLFNIVSETAPMLLHPNTWIRFGVVSIMAAAAKNLGTADVFANLIPILRPYLLSDIIDINEATILESLQSPVSRKAFDNTVASMKYEDETGSPPSISQPELPLSTVLVGQRPATAAPDAIFDSNVMKQNISTEEKAKLTLMAPYLKHLASQRRKDNNSERAPSVNLDKYTKHLSATTQAHMPTPIPPSASGLGGPIIEPALNSPATLHIIGEVGGGVGRNLASDPTLGLLHRMDNNSIPLVGETLKEWQPKGILIAHLHEHRTAVNRIRASRDNLFFATCSDDGTVKIWDTLRLEKNVTNRARLTYSSQGGRIKDITICENSHSVAAASDNGSVHLFRIEYTRKEGTSHRYTGFTTVKNITKTDGAATCIDHFNTNSLQSILVYGTTRGAVKGCDLRASRDAFSLQNAARLGLLSSFIVDKGRNWLLTVTSRGYFTFWDLRFNIPIKVWRHPSKDFVYRLMQHPKQSSWVFSASGNNEIDVWDLETGECKQLFRVLADQETPLAPVIAQPSPHALDFGVQDQKQRPLTEELDPAIMAMYTPPDCPYLITGGTDRRIRLWNVADAPHSYTVSGLPEDSPTPQYNAKQYEGNPTLVYQELPVADVGLKLNRSNASRTRPAAGHHAAILDLECLEMPHRMLISGSRDGVIKVWK